MARRLNRLQRWRNRNAELSPEFEALVALAPSAQLWNGQWIAKPHDIEAALEAWMEGPEAAETLRARWLDAAAKTQLVGRGRLS